jgi:predicted SAM-dependent methyltransferase
MGEKLHLCCGPQLWRGWVNVDIGEFGQEVVADLSKPWTFVESDSVERIHCKDGFEHQPNINHFLAEAVRVLQPGGTLEIWVPHYKNPSAYRFTHTQWFSWSAFNAFPEPHDVTQMLTVTRNRLYIGHKDSLVWAPVHALINLSPLWWERLFYVSNIEVVLQKRS